MWGLFANGLVFQSTLPVRGATPRLPRPRPERRISIHAPRTGSDGSWRRPSGMLRTFQSTLPVRGATPFLHFWPRHPLFQSTLPVRGATWKHCPEVLQGMDFNPRSPYGERLGAPGRLIEDYEISIHAPRTGSDWTVFSKAALKQISIHAPRTGSDVKSAPTISSWADFNPRSPYGERLNCDALEFWVAIFQSTLPVRGATGQARAP